MVASAALMPRRAEPPWIGPSLSPKSRRRQLADTKPFAWPAEIKPFSNPPPTFVSVGLKLMFEPPTLKVISEVTSGNRSSDPKTDMSQCFRFSLPPVCWRTVEVGLLPDGFGFFQTSQVEQNSDEIG
jgi:hypothetical protein